MSLGRDGESGERKGERRKERGGGRGAGRGEGIAINDVCVKMVS